MEALLAREIVVLLAICGALSSFAASFLETRGRVSASRAKQLNRLGYILMGISMVLFIIAGFRAR